MEYSRRGRQLLPLMIIALLAAVALAPSALGRNHRARPAQSSPFDTHGMWIWMLSASDHGNLGAIIARAHRYKINTLYIKSGDGTTMWSQFNSSLVSTLHANGLRVCAWQYVYGSYPLREAQVGARAVHDGADCLAIDAESEYEGKYWQAQRYITRLRQLIGSSFPVALAGLPYVDHHPSFPYSVFLGPNGAQYNAPQMYWRDIGTTVNAVFAHTYTYNRPYQRPIYPLGQVYNAPPRTQIVRFRQLLPAYGATGVSWWDWQEAAHYSWNSISNTISSLSPAAAVAGMPVLRKGAAGDLVVWAQEHLLSAGETVAVDGGFGRQTLSAVTSFQLAHGLMADGVIRTATWTALMSYQPAAVTWLKSGKTAQTVRRSRPLTAGAVAAADNRAGATPPVPLSALLPERGSELAGSPGAGRP
jgi:Putative peptidoglycan binding domain